MEPNVPPKNNLTRKEIEDVMVKIGPMLADMVRKRGRAAIPPDEAEEIVQKVYVALWETSIPKFDPVNYPHVKLTTFLYSCAQNVIIQEMRAYARSVDHRHTDMAPECLEELVDTRVGATEYDPVIERAAEIILENPTKFFTKNQAKVLLALVENQGMVFKKDLAVILNYQQASSLSMMHKRLTEKIMKLDPEAIVKEYDEQSS